MSTTRASEETDFEVSGYKCKIIFNDDLGMMKWFCGYVAIPNSHPAAGKDYDSIDVRVHGGLTFSKKGGEDPRWPDKNLYWVGFDCAHGGDYTGSMFGFGNDESLKHWTLEAVKAETEQLAAQLKAMEK